MTVIVQLNAPIAGRVVPLAEVSDPVFARAMMGQGAAIAPGENRMVVTAPTSGVLTVATKTGHAFGLSTPDGVEILVHIGLDTVQLGGQGFTTHAQRGDHVVAGQPLVTVDVSTIRRANLDPSVIVVVPNTKAMASVTPTTSSTVQQGDPLVAIVTN